MSLLLSVLSTSALCTLAGNANLGLPVRMQSTPAWSWSNASVPARADLLGSCDEQAAEQVQIQPAQPFAITASPGVPDEVNVTAIIEAMIAAPPFGPNTFHPTSTPPSPPTPAPSILPPSSRSDPPLPTQSAWSIILPPFPISRISPRMGPALVSTDVMDPVDDGAFVRLSVFGTLVTQLTFGSFMSFIPLPAQVFVSSQVGILYSVVTFTARGRLYRLRDRWAEPRSLASSLMPALPVLPTLSAAATAPAYVNIAMEAPVLYAAPVLPAYIPTASVVEFAPAQFEVLVVVPEPIRPGPQSPSWRFLTILPNEPFTCSADDAPKSVIVWDPRSFDVETTHAPVQSLQDDVTAPSGAPIALDLAGLVWMFVLAIIALKHRARLAAGVTKTVADAFACVFPAEASPICHQCEAPARGNFEINLSVEDLAESDDDALSAADFVVVKDNETTTTLDFESTTTVTIGESSASCEPLAICSSDIVEVEVAPSFEIIEGYLFERWSNEAIREELPEEVS
ncbi:hypothetical protein DXG01_013469 [Tephrocybe rancida]|nr:hypothetical protein DXG01_013469 [Tephrocybe rancida]